MAAGIYAAAFTAYLLIHDKLKYLDFIIVSILSLAFGIAGAKILYVLTAYPVKVFFAVLWKMLFTKGNPGLSGGFVFYGGLILAPFGYILGCKIAKCRLGAFLKEAAVVIPLGHAFGRAGCFCGGCCYGIPYDGVFSVHYEHTLSSVQTGIGIFPVQLLEAILLLVLFVILLILYRRKVLNPIFYPLGYSVIRFCTEFLRGDAERGKFWIFSTSQWISLFAFVAAGIFEVSVIYLRIRAARKRKAYAQA